jgi:ubiquinol-cytochrome c reductase cytochrome b subunit
MKPPTDMYTMMARVGTFLYFGFFVYLYIYTGMEQGKPVPERLTYHG